MTAVTQNSEHTSISSSLGQSVLDAIVQANLDMNTVSPSTVENMIRSEQHRRGELGWTLFKNPFSVCG